MAAWPWFERVTLSRDVARIRRTLAAYRTSSGNVVRMRRILTASGKSPISRNVGRTLRVLTARGTSSISRIDERRIRVCRTTLLGRVASCGVLARHCRSSGPRNRRSLAVVGARRRLPAGADGSLGAVKRLLPNGYRRMPRTGIFRAITVGSTTGSSCRTRRNVVARTARRAASGTRWAGVAARRSSGYRESNAPYWTTGAHSVNEVSVLDNRRNVAHAASSRSTTSPACIHASGFSAS